MQQQEARYLTNENGERVGVVLGVEEYERLRSDAEEAARMRRHPGVAFRGDEERRRAWVVGTPFDVWVVVDLYRGKGKARLFEEHPISERQLEIALSYYGEHPEEIDEIIRENDQPLEYWREKYPNLDIQVVEY